MYGEALRVEMARVLPSGWSLSGMIPSKQNYRASAPDEEQIEVVLMFTLIEGADILVPLSGMVGVPLKSSMEDIHKSAVEVSENALSNIRMAMETAEKAVAAEREMADTAGGGAPDGTVPFGDDRQIVSPPLRIITPGDM
jgi:hypothetical protein